MPIKNSRKRAGQLHPNKNISFPIGSILAVKEYYDFLGLSTIFSRFKGRGIEINSLVHGHIAFLKRFIDNISEPLIEIFPKDWQNILSSACIKLCYQEPFSRMKIRHDISWSRRLWPGAALSKNSITGLLPRIGRQWNAQREFFKEI